MICSVHWLIEKPATGLGHVIAETPSCALLKVGLKRKMRVVACNLPLEPMSTSASPAPKTDLPGCCSAASITPSNVGVEPNGPAQRSVPKFDGSNNHCSETMPIVPSSPIEISGSLVPCGSKSGVMLKADFGAALVREGTMTAINNVTIAVV